MSKVVPKSGAYQLSKPDPESLLEALTTCFGIGMIVPLRSPEVVVQPKESRAAGHAMPLGTEVI